MKKIGSYVTSSLTSSPTSRFLESEPEPLVSAGGPELAGVHGEEILPAATKLSVNIKIIRLLVLILNNNAIGICHLPELGKFYSYNAEIKQNQCIKGADDYSNWSIWWHMEADATHSLQKRLTISWVQCCLVHNPHDIILNFIIYARKKTVLDTNLKMCWLEVLFVSFTALKIPYF